LYVTLVLACDAGARLAANFVRFHFRASVAFAGRKQRRAWTPLDQLNTVSFDGHTVMMVQNWSNNDSAMLTDSSTPTVRKAPARSAVTNGKAFPGVDGRSRHARRYYDLCADLACDLGGNLSTAEMAIVRQSSALTVRAEELQAAICRGEPVNTDDAVRLANASARLLAALRSKRRLHEPAAVPLRDRLVLAR
jgi:hypothetical protein